MKKIAIHQPNFLPWMGFFEKARMVDKFIFLDHVAFSKGSYTNRVQYFCNSSQTKKWLTLPIENAPIGTPINQVKLTSNPSWESKLIHTISQNISSSIVPQVVEIIQNRNSPFLADLNVRLITCMLEALSIDVTCFNSSNMTLDGSNDQEVLKIMKHCKATYYICGVGGKKYLDERAFAQNDIHVEVVDFKQMLLQNNAVQKERAGLTALYGI